MDYWGSTRLIRKIHQQQGTKFVAVFLPNILYQVQNILLMENLQKTSADTNC
jgi:hypothetical protein